MTDTNPMQQSTALTGNDRYTLAPHEEKYLTERWQSQRQYFSQQSRYYKRWYQSLMLTIGIAGALIPAVVTLDFAFNIWGSDLSSLIASLLGVIVSVATVFENTYNYGDNWRNFRLTLEALKREKSMYETRTGPYRDVEKAFDKFVTKTENIIAQDVKRYAFLNSEQDDQRSIDDNAGQSSTQSTG